MATTSRRKDRGHSGDRFSYATTSGAKARVLSLTQRGAKAPLFHGGVRILAREEWKRCEKNRYVPLHISETRASPAGRTRRPVPYTSYNIVP